METVLKQQKRTEEKKAVSVVERGITNEMSCLLI